MMSKKISILIQKTFRIIPTFNWIIILILLEGCNVYNAFNTVFNEHWSSDINAGKGEPRIEYYHSVPIIHLYGTPYEMGSQYGIILKNQLESLNLIANKFFSQKTINKYIELAKKVENTLPDETLSFISGMAEKSGVDYQILLAINTVPKTTCSVLAVWGEATADGNLLMGRNADYNLKKINKGLGIIVVKHPDEGYGTVASSFLGLAGTFTGINEKGVCYGNMLVYNGYEEENHTEGLPVQVLMQEAAEKATTAKEMINIIVQGSHLTPVNVMCADSSEAIIAELGLNNHAIRKGDKGVLAATNYFYSSGMFIKPESDQRFSRLMLQARDNYGIFDLEYLREAMHLARKKNQNLQCVLFEPSKKMIHISMNSVPASKGPFFKLDVTKLLQQ